MTAWLPFALTPIALSFSSHLIFCMSLHSYVDRLSQLRKDKNRKHYPSYTGYTAPHKPLLLLSVIDLIAEGELNDNLIRLTPDLCDTFHRYWDRVMPEGNAGDVAMPFFHLTGDGFWRLLPQPGSETVIASGKRLISIRLLHDHTKGAHLDEGLFDLLSTHETREILRAALIESHFTEEIRELVAAQGKVNVESFRYSKQLLEHARQREDIQQEQLSDKVPEPVRNQGFRRAIVAAYDNYCAVSGIRILTADNRSAVEACHIVPWSISKNDNPTNGIALSKLCHWVFERGLLSITPEYKVRLSRELLADYNSPGNLAQLEGRSIRLPNEKALRPGREYLAWHAKKLFRA